MKRRLFYVLRLVSALGGIGALFLGWNAISTENYSLGFFAWCVFTLSGGLFAAADHLHTDSLVKWSEDLGAVELKSVMSKGGYNYCLILRPFNADADIRMKNTFNPFVWLGIGFGMPIVDAQEWIIRCCPTGWRFFSWGGKTGAIRPSRVISGEDWFDELKGIAKSADVVVIFPGSSESISRELDFILQEIVHHSVIFFPPRDQNDRLYRQIEGSPSLNSRFRDLSPAGCLILPFRTPDGDLSLAARYPLNARSFRRVLEARRAATEA